MTFIIKTSRCYLRKLTTRDDLSRYLFWMSTPKNNPFILSARSNFELDELQQFIRACNSSKDVLLLGVFTNDKNLHIGNIKINDIDFINKSATLGILIGDGDFRGKGIAGEVIEATILNIWKELGIQVYNLGVDPNNIPALKLYKRLGFQIIEKSITSGIVMQLNKNL